MFYPAVPLQILGSRNVSQGLFGVLRVFREPPLIVCRTWRRCILKKLHNINIKGLSWAQKCKRNINLPFIVKCHLGQENWLKLSEIFPFLMS